MPGDRTAIGALSRAIARLEADPFPMALEARPAACRGDGALPAVLEAPAHRQPLAHGAAGSTRARDQPLGAALLHTTTAPTMLQAGIKDNVLPPEASAVVNFRIFPGETIASVTERVTRVVDDGRIIVGPLDSVGANPSPVSDVASPAYRLVAATIAAMAPGERVPVIPYLVMGGTDAKYWGAHTDRVFRFLAVPLALATKSGSTA